MTGLPDRSDRIPVDEERLKLVLRAEFAEFRNEIVSMIANKVDDKIGQREHLELAEQVKDVRVEVSRLKTWQSKIVGGLAVAIFLSGAALEIAVRHYIH